MHDKLKAQTTLKELFPNGHPEFIPLMVQLMELHSKKNHDYAGGGDPLGNFNRVAMILQLYQGKFPYDSAQGVAMIYMLKQLDAVLWMLSQGTVAQVEGLDSRLADISVYASLVRCMERELQGYTDNEEGGEM